MGAGRGGREKCRVDQQGRGSAGRSSAMTSPGTRVSHEAAVLIVEDGPLVRAFAADILMDAGYRVFEACEAADALTLLEGRADIGMVFTDIEMSGMTDRKDVVEGKSEAIR